MISNDTDQPHTTATSSGTVLLLDNDLFFVVKVTETLAHAGYLVRKTRTVDAFAAALGEPGAQRPTAALVNLAARGVDAMAAIARAREAGVPIMAYGPHVDTAAQAGARRAGATSVIANAKLASDLPGVLARAVRRAGNAVVNDRRTDGGVNAAETVDGQDRAPALQGRDEP